MILSMALMPVRDFSFLFMSFLIFFLSFLEDVSEWGSWLAPAPAADDPSGTAP